MNLEEYIPFDKKEFRPYQKEAVMDIIKAIDDGYENIILNAPVGIGKSLIAYVLASHYKDTEDYSTYIYTKTKYLQDQYLKDFKDMITVKGRNNFTCTANPAVSCDVGCKNILTTCPYKPDLNEPLLEDEEYCEYWTQKHNGIHAPITLLNYAYVFADSMYIQHFPMRHLAICDEGHNIEKELMGVLENRLSVTKIKKETGITIPHQAHMRTMSEWVDLLYEISVQYKTLAKKTKDLIAKDNYKERSQSLLQTSVLIDENIDNWVVKDESFKGHVSIIFKPIMVHKYSNLLLDKAHHNVIMSGSILKPDLFAKELGLDDYKYIEVPSIIPAVNRPIKKAYCGSMSNRNFEFTFPVLVERIKQLIEHHSDSKGVIHTFTYKIANRLKEVFSDNPRFIFHDSNTTNKAIFRFKTTKRKNAILVSPVVFEGVDFLYDEARWQAICKDPFPNIGDKQISAREDVDFGWIFRQRCLVLSQMYGRTNRAVDDKSVTYLLDSNIESLLGPSTLVTDYFLEGLEGLNYTRPFELCEYAYDKLTPDKRRSYEQERFEERSILDAIKLEDLNTLEKLRMEYKKIPDNNSYQLVMPIVERLLKNGAIKYIE